MVFLNGLFFLYFFLSTTILVFQSIGLSAIDFHSCYTLPNNNSEYKNYFKMHTKFW